MNPSHTDTIQLGAVARTIGNGWRAIAACTLVGAALAFVVIGFAPRRYTGISSLVFRDSGRPVSSVFAQLSGLGAAGGLLGGKSMMETEIEVLQSRTLVGAVVDSLHLQARLKGPVALPSSRALEALDAPGSFIPFTVHFERQGQTFAATSPNGSANVTPGVPAQIGGISFTLSRQFDFPGQFDMILRDHEDATAWVSSKLAVGNDRGEVAAISYTGTDSVTAAAVPNALIEIYMARRRGSDRGANQRRLEFLMAKSDSIDRALAAAAGALRRQQESSGVLEPLTLGRVELESSIDLRRRLADVRTEQGALEQLMNEIRSKTATPRQLAAYPSFLQSQAVNDLVRQLSDLETRRTILLKDRATTDPEVVAIEKSARDVEAQLMPYAETYAASLRRQRDEIEKSLAAMDRRLAQLPRAAESAALLQREVLDLTNISAAMQAQIVDARLAAIGEGGDVKPLDTAVPPKRPSFPNPMVVATAGIGGGLISGIIMALIVGSVGRWMRDPFEIERSTGIRAIRFDPAAPFLLSSGGSRTLVVAPIEDGGSVGAIVTRLAQTAASRATNTGVLDLTAPAAEPAGTIARMEAEHDLLIVQLSSLTSESAVATLQPGRPVLLVTPSRRTDRRRLNAAIDMLQRIDVPVAGIVMNDADASGRARIGS